MSAYETLIFEKKGPVAYVTLNRPDALNAHNIQMRDDMSEVLGAIKDDEDVRATVFKGAGQKAFCAGADLSEFLTAPPPTAAREVRFDTDLWGLFLSIPHPIVAALHGFVLGSGIEIALCCDIRIATEDARFGLPEMGLGMIPAAGGTQTVPRVVGSGKALDMILTNRWISAAEAQDAGLVNRVVSREQLYPLADEMAERIAASDPVAVRKAKETILGGLDLPLPMGLDMERRAFLSLP
jgi:enoyl-CoA hydratase/carnithine racemase